MTDTENLYLVVYTSSIHYHEILKIFKSSQKAKDYVDKTIVERGHTIYIEEWIENKKGSFEFLGIVYEKRVDA